MRELTFFRRGRGGSGIIRGVQMAEYFGAKLNPKEGYKDDICIYVKFEPPEDFPKHSYLDIVDGKGRVAWLLEHPDIGVIASSLTGYEYLKKKLNRDDIVFIPQHHCNYERRVSTAKGIGVCGGKGAIQTEIPLDYTHLMNVRKREVAADFYMTIGVQIIWRKTNWALKNPLKIVNAMSFGIPTVALPEIGYKEVDGYYTKVHSVKELVYHAKRLAREGISDREKQRLMKKAEEYHIDNIAKLYRKLK